MRADYIGAKVKISHSRCKTQIGIEGIVALETKVNRVGVFLHLCLPNRIVSEHVLLGDLGRPTAPDTEEFLHIFGGRWRI